MSKYLFTQIFLIISLSALAGYWCPSEAESPSSRTRRTNQMNTKAFQVEWFLPEMGKSFKNSRIVFLMGKAPPGSQVRVLKRKIPIMRKHWKSPKFLSSKKISRSSKKSGTKGYFALPLRLPLGVSQVPIQIVSEGQKRHFDIRIEVDTLGAQIASAKKLKPSPLTQKNSGFWAGLGYNYLSYEQGQYSFQSFEAPAWYLKFWLGISPQWSFDLVYKSAIGSTTSNPNLQVDKGSYTWRSLTSDVVYSPYSFDTFGYPSKLGFLIGYHLHFLPFILQSSETSVRVEEEFVHMASAGVRIDIRPTPRWQFEAFLRAQTPFTSGSLFEIEPSLAVDGSVGIIRRFTSTDFRVGLFSYGQWFQYNTIHTNPVTSQSETSNHNLLFSNIELRAGYEF